MAKNKPIRRQHPIVTAEEIIANLKNRGVVIEKTTRPFKRGAENQHASIMDNYYKRFVLK